MAYGTNIFVLFSNGDPGTKTLEPYDLFLRGVSNDDNKTILDSEKLDNPPVLGYNIIATEVDSIFKVCTLQIIKVTAQGKQVVDTIKLDISDLEAKTYQIPNTNVYIQCGIISVDPENQYEVIRKINNATNTAISKIVLNPESQMAK